MEMKAGFCKEIVAVRQADGREVKFIIAISGTTGYTTLVKYSKGGGKRDSRREVLNGFDIREEAYAEAYIQAGDYVRKGATRIAR